MTRRRLVVAGFAAIVLAALLVLQLVQREQAQRQSAEREIRQRFAQLESPAHAGEIAPQLWSHRGYHRGGAPENSIESLQAAVALGFPGVELDVFWGPPLIVQHGVPSLEQIAKRDYLTLTEIFAVTPPETYLYLDFKNLSAENAAAVSEKLGPLLAPGDRLRRTFVESKSWAALSALRDYIPDVRTLYWLTGYDDPIAVQAAVLKSGARAVSIQNSLITEAFLRDFAHLRIHTFTVNFADRARELAKAGVSVILTDVDFSSELPAMMTSVRNQEFLEPEEPMKP